jgi:xanthosine utilization system XapX-like protein
MKIQIELVRPRWARLPRTRRRRVLVALLAVAVLAVPVAWASHDFGDVPTASPHHDDVTAIRQAGITTGCNPPANTAYCPDQPVRRDQMASFLRRGLGRVGLSGFEGVPGTTVESVVGTRQIVAGVPSAADGPDVRGFVRADAAVTIHVTDASGCPCTFVGNLFLEGGFWMAGRFTLLTVREPGDYVMPLVGVAGVSSGVKTVQVRVWRPVGSAEALAWGNLAVSYFPFGPFGGNGF